MGMLENIEERLSRVPGGRWIASAVLFLLFGGLWHIFDLVEKIPDASLWVLKFLVAGNHANEIHVEPTPLGRFVVLVVYVLLVTALCGAIFFHATWRRRMEERHARRYAGHFLRQAGDVYKWLGTRDDLPFSESQVTRDFVIRPNYDVEYTEKSTYRADGTHLYAIAFEVQSDQGLGDDAKCDFRIRSLTPDVNIVCIPAEEGATRARYVSLIVPPVPVGHPGVEIEVRAKWPQAAKKLEKPNRPDTLTYQVKKRIRQPLDEVKVSVTVELDGSFRFQCEVAATDCNDSSTIGNHPKHFQVVARNVQPRGDIGIRVTREPKTAQAPAGD